MKIIISTDGSDFSRTAVEKACQIIADPKNTEVKVVAVYQAVLPLDAFQQSVEYAEKEERSEQAKAEEFAQARARVIEEKFPNSGLSITSQAIMGAPDQILIDSANKWKADIIVVGSHGRGFLERTFQGSISDSLVHHAPCSVFVVRPTKHENTN